MKSAIKYALVACFLTACASRYSGEASPQVAAGAGVQVVNPPWAPAYYPGVRYYYLPDVEMYYDLYNRDFVYLDNGQWMFSPVLPPIYSGYDLYNGFVVALNVNVYEPWRHHQFYVSHYPRFYYRSVYPRTTVANIRGFNENGGKPVYWRGDVRNRTFGPPKTEPVPPKIESRRPPQEPHYYGREIGRPVRVTSRMREAGRKR